MFILKIFRSISLQISSNAQRKKEKKRVKSTFSGTITSFLLFPPITNLSA